MSSDIVDAFVEAARHDVASGHYAAAINRVSGRTQSELELLSDDQLNELGDLINRCLSSLSGQPEIRVRGYDVVVKLTDMQMKRGVSGKIKAEREAAAAQFKKAAVLFTELNRVDEAISTYSKIAERYRESEDAEVWRLVAKAMVNRGLCLASVERYEEAIRALGEMEENFGGAVDEVIRERVAKALVCRGISLTRCGRYEEAIEAFDQVERRYGNDQGERIEGRVAVALMDKMLVLVKVGREEEGLSLCHEAIRRYGDSEEQAKRWAAATAMNEIGFLSLRDAKQLIFSGDMARGRELLIATNELLSAAIEYNAGDPIIVGNLGYVRFLLGEREEAERMLGRAIGQGGERLRRIELNDSEISPLPEDAEFRALILALPADEEAKNYQPSV